jgi:hypothetical protein
MNATLQSFNETGADMRTAFSAMAFCVGSGLGQSCTAQDLNPDYRYISLMLLL